MINYESRNQKPLTVRFWSKVSKQEQGCWTWRGDKRNGYGTLKIKGRAEYAHRLSWFLNSGEWPPRGICVLHRCDTPSCVNPEHLFLGTKKDNAIDAASKGRNAAQRRPEIRRGSRASRAILTELIVVEATKLHKSGGMTYRDLAAKYGVHATTIAKAVKGVNWPHVSREND